MKLLNLLKKTEKTAKSGKFSDFFLHASEKKREEILREAANKANEEQRDIFKKSCLKAKTY